jgi:hypothetical protein
MITRVEASRYLCLREVMTWQPLFWFPPHKSGACANTHTNTPSKSMVSDKMNWKGSRRVT